MGREGGFFGKKQGSNSAGVFFKIESVKNERFRREFSDENNNNNNNSNAVDVDVQKCEKIRHAIIQFRILSIRDCQSKK